MWAPIYHSLIDKVVIDRPLIYQLQIWSMWHLRNINLPFSIIWGRKEERKKTYLSPRINEIVVLHRSKTYNSLLRTLYHVHTVTELFAKN